MVICYDSPNRRADGSDNSQNKMLNNYNDNDNSNNNNNNNDNNDNNDNNNNNQNNQNLHPHKMSSIMSMLEEMVETRSWNTVRGLIEDGIC